MRSHVSWLAVGAVCGFGLTIVSLTFTVVIGLGLAVAGLVRRRADSYSAFVLGFAVGLAVYLALAALTALVSSSPTSGSRSGGGT